MVAVVFFTEDYGVGSGNARGDSGGARYDGDNDDLVGVIKVVVMPGGNRSDLGRDDAGESGDDGVSVVRTNERTSQQMRH